MTAPNAPLTAKHLAELSELSELCDAAEADVADDIAQQHDSAGNTHEWVAEVEITVPTLRRLIAAARPQPAPVDAGEFLEKVVSWRPEVIAFANLMESQLRANDHKPGWKGERAVDLFPRLYDEAEELEGACNHYDVRPDRVAAEAADVANFAMMIADVCGALNGAAPLTAPSTLDQAALAQLRSDLERANGLVDDAEAAAAKYAEEGEAFEARALTLGDLVREAAEQFRFYEHQHRAKGTSDADAKAEVNRKLAEKLEAALAQPEPDERPKTFKMPPLTPDQVEYVRDLLAESNASRQYDPNIIIGSAASAPPVAQDQGALRAALDQIISKVHRQMRVAEMSSDIMLDPKRTGNWPGAQRTADAFDRIGLRLAEIKANLAAFRQQEEG